MASSLISHVSPCEAFNRVVAESVLIFDCCLTPAALVPGAVALDPELSSADASRAAYDWAMEELGPENPRMAVVFDEDRGSAAAGCDRGQEVAEWLVENGGCTRVWTVDREAFAKNYGFAMGAKMDVLWAHPQEIIEDSVFLGSILAVNPAVLANLRITHVVSVMERDPPNVGELARIHCCVADSTSADLEPTLDEALTFIAAALSSGGRVLVHCEQGQSRSASVVIAHLLRVTPGLGVDEALAIVKAQRPLARPNAGFMDQLRRLAAEQASTAA